MFIIGLFNRSGQKKLTKGNYKQFKQDKFQEMLEHYDNILETSFRDIENHSQQKRSFCGVKIEDFDRFSKVLEIKPDYVEAWHGRGVVLDQLGRYQEAIESYDKTLELEPKKVEACNKVMHWKVLVSIRKQ